MPVGVTPLPVQARFGRPSASLVRVRLYHPDYQQDYKITYSRTQVPYSVVDSADLS